MNKKRLNPDVIANELTGHSAFFPAPQPKDADPTRQPSAASEPPMPAPQPAHMTASKPASTLAHEDTELGITTKSNEDTTAEANADTRIDTDAGADVGTDMIEAIRKIVKQVGKEVSFVRLLPEEKHQLADIAYTYKSQGIKTSENEIARIGIDFILEDYHANGKASILAQVIAALNA